MESMFPNIKVFAEWYKDFTFQCVPTLIYNEIIDNICFVVVKC